MSHNYKGAEAFRKQDQRKQEISAIAGRFPMLCKPIHCNNPYFWSSTKGYGLRARWLYTCINLDQAGGRLRDLKKVFKKMHLRGSNTDSPKCKFGWASAALAHPRTHYLKLVGIWCSDGCQSTSQHGKKAGWIHSTIIECADPRIILYSYCISYCICIPTYLYSMGGTRLISYPYVSEYI